MENHPDLTDEQFALSLRVEEALNDLRILRTEADFYGGYVPESQVERAQRRCDNLLAECREAGIEWVYWELKG